MLKKGLGIGVVAVLLMGLAFGTGAGSYVRTSLGWVRQSVRDSVPLEFELGRARQMIKEIDPEVQRNMHLIAKEEVEIKQLQDRLAEGEKHLSKSEADMKRLSTDLKRGDSTFVYCGKNYTSKQVETDLAHRFTQHKTKDATVTKLRQILTAREQGLNAGREKLREMLAAKSQLEVDVANLEARNEMVKVAQTTSNFSFDHSQLARTKEIVREIGTRIDVAEKLVTAESPVSGQINLDETANADIAEQVTAYLSGGSTPEHANVVKLD